MRTKVRSYVRRIPLPHTGARTEVERIAVGLDRLRGQQKTFTTIDAYKEYLNIARSARITRQQFGKLLQVNQWRLGIRKVGEAGVISSAGGGTGKVVVWGWRSERTQG